MEHQNRDALTTQTMGSLAQALTKILSQSQVLVNIETLNIREELKQNLPKHQEQPSLIKLPETPKANQDPDSTNNPQSSVNTMAMFMERVLWLVFLNSNDLLK